MIRSCCPVTGDMTLYSSSAYETQTMSSNHGSYSSVASLPAVMFVASIATLVQSYVLVKLFFLAVFLLTAIVRVALRKTRFAVHPRLVLFYLWIGVAGIVWAIVGLLHPGNYVQGNLDALKLYVTWSAAFVILYTLLRAEPSLRLLHAAVVSSAILISVINLVGLADEIGSWGLISESIREELELYVGIHTGYIQITSNNIGALFVIVPYLLSLQFRADAGKVNSAFMKVALALSLVAVAVSGRRALWLAVVLTPCTILLLSGLTGSYGLLKIGGRRFLLICTLAAVAGLSVVLLVPDEIPELGSLVRLNEAFSSENERGIQKAYLIDGFMESPILGSGFGAYAGYLRSYERPWTYELTYYRLLFNMGIVGTASLGTLFFLYFALVIRILRRFKDGSAIPFGLLVGFCSLLLGSYSNPYFGSFDYIFFVGLLPYLSTFRGGFDRVGPLFNRRSTSELRAA